MILHQTRTPARAHSVMSRCVRTVRYPHGVTTHPEVAKRVLARELRALRVEARMLVPAVAGACRWSQAKIRHLETGRNPPSYPDLKALLELYGALGQLGHFDELWTAARKPGWWDEYQLPPVVREYMGLEDAAAMVERFTLEIVPGMLQTEAYARAVVRKGGSSPDDEDGCAGARSRRGERVRRGEITLLAVMSQTLLARAANMGATGVEQLRHLHAATALPNVELRVRPFRVGSQMEARSGFTLLSFPPGTLDPIAHLDQAGGDIITEKASTVASLRSTFEALRHEALSPEESANLIQSLAR